MISQSKMQECAFNQAHDRARREGKPCFIFRRANHPEPGVVTWYVRTADEGKPEGAEYLGFCDGR
jgi:hypothetical protein